MKISWNWLQEWVNLDSLKTPDQLAELLTARGLEVESIHRQNKGFEKVISVQILSREKHPEADRLSVCVVNPGSNERLEIVCGAQNMKVGDIVALAQIGADLPNGLKIEKSKIRGVVSNGMLCSEEELRLKEKSEGILILPKETPLGWNLAEILNLNDSVLELKLTANRGDCLSHRGLAREIRAALGSELKVRKVQSLPFDSKDFKIELRAGEDAPQFFAAHIKGVKVGPSPKWLANRLQAIGQRSINNVVDAANFIMFELGFPVHVYDAQKIEGNLLAVDRAKEGEEIPLLDGGLAKMKGFELVIRDSTKPVGLAGVMGGGNSEVSESSKDLILEVAEFNSTLVRRAAFAHQRRSEASMRFEKGIDSTGLAEACNFLADLILRVAGGTVIASFSNQLDSRKNFRPLVLLFDQKDIQQKLGLEIPETEAKKLLEGLGFKVEGQTHIWKVTVPSHRKDISISEDLLEEIARTVGYEKIPLTLPALNTRPDAKLDSKAAHRISVIDRAKDLLAGFGLNEALTYSFQNKNWMSQFGLESAVPVLNPISEEHEAMVPSLIPGLFKAVLENQRHHFGSEPLPVRLFEIRPTFHKGESAIESIENTKTGVIEKLKMTCLISGPRYEEALKVERGEVDFYDLKGLLENFFERLGTSGVRMKAVSAEAGKNSIVFHGGQCVEIFAGKDRIGYAGRVHPKLEKSLKLRNPVYGVEIDFDPVIQLTRKNEIQFQAWSNFPNSERDFALLIPAEIQADQLIQSALKSGKPIAKNVKIFDIYRGAHVPEGKVSVALRVFFSDPKRSLAEAEVETASSAILKKWSEEFGALQR